MINITLLVLSAAMAAFTTAYGELSWAFPAALVAYAIFWRVQWNYSSRIRPFLLAMGWFTASQLAHISFLSSHEYQGYYIFFLWFGLSVLFSVQFAVLSMLVTRERVRYLVGCAGIAGLWVLFEWSRHYILTGFPWSSVGFHLSGSSLHLPLASAGGLFALVFLVIFTNLLSLRLWENRNNRRYRFELNVVVIAPFLLGVAHMAYHRDPAPETTSVLLVQGGKPPREIMAQRGVPLVGYGFDQWQDALGHLSKHKDAKVGLIAFPEGFVPFSDSEPIYPIDYAQLALLEAFGSEIQSAFPEDSPAHVGNGYFAQTIANYFNAQVVVGLDAYEDGHSYNAALHFSPNSGRVGRYEKRILLPMAEYIPFEWASAIASTYGINGSFTPGKEAKVFSGQKMPPYSVVICSEEAYGGLVREGRLLGAQAIVAITNDGWYPNSKLPRLHFEHARVRAVENGAPVIRACSTGITGVIDCMGRTVSVLGDEQGPYEFQGGAIRIDVPIHHYDTLYTRLGNLPVLSLSLLFVGLLVPLSFRMRTSNPH